MAEFIDAKEFDEAVAAAKEAAQGGLGQLTVEIREPLVYEGKTYTELHFDFDKLTGADSLAIEAELITLRKATISPEFSGEFLVRMAARACTEKVNLKVLQGLPIGTFNKIRDRARSFLLLSAL